MRRGARLFLVSAFLIACGSDQPAEDDDLPLLDGSPNEVPDGGGKDGSIGPREAGTNPKPDAQVVVEPPPPGCRDGVRAEAEECDDGNLADGDGCDPSCKREAGWNCPPMGGRCAPVCGDSLLVAGESCDDGDAEPSDGCSETCAVEAGWSCLSSGAACTPAACGDGVPVGGEGCDDGNALPGDGCSTSCGMESGWLCPVAGMDCIAAGCGDGVRAGDEACDDQNLVAGDGCTAACDAVEPNAGCPDTGGACTRTSVCGNGLLTTDEECDDRNSASGDGCSATCRLEAGWSCAAVGRACAAATCGDTIVAGSERCEDGNAVAADGCADCQIEPGWACDWVAGRSSCHLAVCGDQKREGNETCDDGNDVVGDGCSPTCAIEPTCLVGQPCNSACGDGIKLAADAEQCDDGNVTNGDGCSSDCMIEAGFSCTDVRSALPETFPLAVVYRDFIRAVAGGVSGVQKHPDFDSFGGSGTAGLVGDTLVSGKPNYTGICDATKSYPQPACPHGRQTTSKVAFDQWYANANVPNVMSKYVTTLNMVRQPSGAYRNPTFGQQLFPLDGRGFAATTPVTEPTYETHNFGFTSEIRHWFQFDGGEVLTFSGDDDVWVFIAGRLALDLGGLHSKLSRTIVLDAQGNVSCFIGNAPSGTSCGTRALGLVPGNVYEMALFHAERHIIESNFDLTLTGFIAARSQCVSMCGDGVMTADEVCDEGKACVGGTQAGMSCSSDAGCPGGTCVSKNDGSYGHCAADCQQYGPRCGDGTMQAGEACDNGFAQNRGGYNGCSPDCTVGPRCGDSKVDGVYGEQCDLGPENVGGYNGCTAACRFAERCGDAILQSPAEVCDDGMNRSVYGGCGPGCMLAPFCGDGQVQRARGEQCDDGADKNDGHYGGCAANCARAPRCGDHVVDAAAGEECDDGNANNYDGCSAACRFELFI